MADAAERQQCPLACMLKFEAIHDSGGAMATENIFSGLKVVDLASFIAGPGAATVLSDFGDRKSVV